MSDHLIIFYLNHRNLIMYSTLCLLLILGISGGCSLINRELNLKDDHPVEEFIEFKIEEATGFSMDLSPGSEE